MASYNELNALIDAYINRNGVQAITGQILNGVLKAMVEQLGRGYTIMGAATPTTDPGTPDGPECYFASTPGTYTDFDGLQVVPGELALLCYTPTDGWTKETIYEGFQEVQAIIDGNVGTPSVGVSYANGVLSFDFRNMKGNPGDAAGFGTIGADITGGVGTPGVTVESSGPAAAKNLQFHFTNLKGETGVTSVVATVDNTTGTPACTVSLVGQQLTLAFTGLKGAQGNTGSSVDYPFTIVNNLTTDDATQALSAAQGKVLDGKVSQLQHEVDGLNETITEADVTSESGRWLDNNGVIGTGTSGALHRAAAIDLTNYTAFSLTTDMSWAITDAAYLCDNSGNIVETIPRLPNPGDPTVITNKAVPEGATKLYTNFATAFTFVGTSPSIEEKFNDAIEDLEEEVKDDIEQGVADAVTAATNAANAAIEEYQEDYGARVIGDNSTPMSLDENDFESGNLDNNGNEIPATNAIRSGYIEIVPGANYIQSTSNSYRANIYVFNAQKTFIQGYSWHTGTYQNTFSTSGVYIRIIIASPSGVTTAPVWDDVQFSLTISKVYKPTRAAAESEVEKVMEDYFNLELPILSPSPQLPADGETGSDFNAETMTSVEIQSAIESQIAKLSIPNVGVNPYTPKYGTIYETIGKDASGLYDIKAYVFTRRNRFAWRASATLYAWKSGSMTYYTDHRSPLVGDTVYSNNTRTDSGYTVTSYNSAGPSITVNGNTYTRDDAAKVDATDIFTQSAPSATTTSIVAYNKSGVSVGTATVSSPTQIVLGGKTYTRLTSGDFHTENKATIVIWGNEHGPQSDPSEPSIIIYRLIKDLCECSGGEFLMFLRKYCKFVFIPAANPYGINKFVSDGREGRTNFNNVNINRNYDTVGWGVQTDINKGSYAGDQPETQFIMNTALDVAADIAIDIHCLGYNSTPLNEGRTHYEGYVSALNGKVSEIMVGYCGHSYTSYGAADPSTKSTGADWIYSLGIAGGLIEMNAGPYAVSYDGKQHKAGIMFTDYTLLLNTLRMWYYNFDPTLDLSKMSIK